MTHFNCPQIPEDRNLISNQIHTPHLFTSHQFQYYPPVYLQIKLALSFLKVFFRHKHYRLLHILKLPSHATCYVHLIILYLAVLTMEYKIVKPLIM